MTDPDLTPVPGTDGEFYALSENVPDGWQWRTKTTERWHTERLEPTLAGVVVMCRVRPKRWSARLDGAWMVYDGEEPVLTVLLDNGEGLARRLVVFLNGEDAASQLVRSMAAASRNPKLNMWPYVQEAVRIAAQLEGRTESSI